MFIGSRVHVPKHTTKAHSFLFLPIFTKTSQTYKSRQLLFGAQSTVHYGIICLQMQMNCYLCTSSCKQKWYKLQCLCSRWFFSHYGFFNPFFIHFINSWIFFFFFYLNQKSWAFPVLQWKKCFVFIFLNRFWRHMVHLWNHGLPRMWVYYTVFEHVNVPHLFVLRKLWILYNWKGRKQFPIDEFLLRT